MNKRFPIQNAGTVPWEEAEVAYNTYTRLFGNQQSLERLAERAGFGILEFCALYLGYDPLSIVRRKKIEIVVARVASKLGDKWEISER